MNTFEEMKMMVAELNYYTKLYDEGNPQISDREWDEKYFRLLDFENKTGIRLPNSPTQKVDYQIVNSLNKVTHNHSMLSLAKTKDWDEFIKYFGDKDVIGMLKLDGLTGSLKYINGNLVSAETRGNGEIGEDILHNALVVKNIPKKIKYTDELIIDGEFIITDKDFEPFSMEYANSRNLAAGSVRLLDSRECASRNLTFVVWNVVSNLNEKTFHERLAAVKNLGFTITPYTTSFDFDAKEFLVNKAKELGYPIDGLVGRFDDIEYGDSLGSTGHHSRAAYAFKFYDDEYETTLKNVEYDVSRNGEMTPVAIFDPVDDGISTVERASLHNLNIMEELLHSPSGWVGQNIKIYKANMIIPQVSEAEQDDNRSKMYIDIPSTCPICGKPTEIRTSESGIRNLFCSNSDCPRRLINRLEHYCSKKGMDIKGLSKATLEKLINWGWVDSITDIYNLHTHKKEWINKPGFGGKSVLNILEAIENKKECSLDGFISAISIPLIGVRAAKDLANRYNTWENFRDTVINNFKDILSIGGFGYEMAHAIKDFDYAEADEIAKMLKFKEAIPIQSVNNELAGKVVCITGKLIKYKNRDAFAADIESHGGKVTGSVTSKTNYLVNNDTESNSAKNVSAKRLNVEIISENDFINQFLI